MDYHPQVGFQAMDLRLKGDQEGRWGMIGQSVTGRIEMQLPLLLDHLQSQWPELRRGAIYRRVDPQVD